VSLDELPSTFTSAETVALEQLQKQILHRLYGEGEGEDVEEAEELQPVLIPRILYCDEIREGSSYEGEREGEMGEEAPGEEEDEGYANYRLPRASRLEYRGEAVEHEHDGEGAALVALTSERTLAHSSGSIDTPEGCRRKDLSL